MFSEFEIIRRCFDQKGLAAQTGNIIREGIGDDCALVSVPPGQALALSMDTLVEGVHFPRDAAPEDIAWRALAVNLSDLAATGASPVFFTLGLSLPNADQSWLEAFANGLGQSAGQYGCYLAGGDTTCGPLTITIQAHGLVRENRAILRSGASPGDRIFVTGTLGKAALALRLFGDKPLAVEEEARSALHSAFYHPQPRLAAGCSLAEFVSAGLDISDGLLGDLFHICEKSICGAKVRLNDIPVDPLVSDILGHDQAQELALNGGDDYELILTVPTRYEQEFLEAAAKVPVEVTCIGEMTQERTLVCLDTGGNPVEVTRDSYTHFQEKS